MSATVLSQHFGCTRKAIERLRRRFRVTGNVADRPRSGRPRVTTAADARHIVLQHLRNRRLSAAATGKYRGYLFFSVKDQNSFHRVDTIGNIFTSGAATSEILPTVFTR